MNPLRVLIVDDSATVRLLLPRLLLSSEYVAEAIAVPGGEEALEIVEKESFDVVILDQEMPGMDGLETLDRLRETKPRLPVIMFSALTKRGARLTLDALARGARTYVTKPSGMGSRSDALEATRNELLGTIYALFEKMGKSQNPGPPVRFGDVAPRYAGPVRAVVVAASTGGPNVISRIVEQLPATIAVPILIVQHMPPLFTAMFASRLDKLSELTVKEAYEGATSNAATIWVAPGDSHLTVRRQRSDGTLVLGLDSGPRRHGCRPCADTLFESAVQVLGGAVLGVVLSGMGKDGLSGSESIVRAGGRVVVQDAVTSVVWSMPGSVARAGLADKVLEPDQIAVELQTELRVRTSRERPS